MNNTSWILHYQFLTVKYATAVISCCLGKQGSGGGESFLVCVKTLLGVGLLWVGEDCSVVLINLFVKLCLRA